YELGFSQAQVDRVVDHLWEMGPAYFDYFFFTENCSYHLLAVIETAIPERDIVAGLPYWVIPSDTVKAIAAEPGLIHSAQYRPSTKTLLETGLEGLSPDESTSLRQIVETQSLSALPASAPADRKAAILDTALDYTDFKDPESQKNPERPASPWKRSLL